MRLPFTFRVSTLWTVPAILTGLTTIVVGAGAAAAIESETVDSYWHGLWWSISLITTVGFIGEPPRTTGGAVLSAVLMVVGFLLLAMVSASLAALFVREEEVAHEEREASSDEEILAALQRLESRLDSLEQSIDRDSRRGEQVMPPATGAAGASVSELHPE